MKISKQNWKYYLFICMGIMMLITTGIAYLPGIISNGMYEFELTFLSNLITGFVFIAGGSIGLLQKKELPQIYYLNSSIFLVLVFLTCMAFFKEMNFSGAFLFLHIINPIVALIVFVCFTSDGKKLKKIELVSTFFLPIIYLVYAIAYGILSGYWLYGFINIDDKGTLYVSIVCIIMAAGIFVVSVFLHRISRAVYKMKVNK